MGPLPAPAHPSPSHPTPSQPSSAARPTASPPASVHPTYAPPPARRSTPAGSPTGARHVSTDSAPGTGVLPVLGAEVTVPLADGRETPYAALDHAASTPAAHRVWEEVAAFLPHYGSVHRGAGQLSRLTTDRFEESRATVAEFLHCRPDDQVVFTRSTTDALNLLSACLPAGTRVLAFDSDHHAALLPWRRHPVTWLPAPSSPRDAVAAVDAALREAPAGPTLLCVTGASNVTGELWPVRELTAAAHRHGARVVLDAAQLAPHRPVDLTDLDVDWVAFSGHKLYAPFGAGVLAGRPDWLDTAEPYLAGGGASRSVTGSADAAGGLAVRWHDGVARHEAGSPNAVGAVALAAACRALRDTGWSALLRHERELLDRLRAGLATVPGLRELALWGQDSDRVAVVSVTVEGHDSAELAGALADRYGIGVRAGQFCAHPLVRHLTGAREADGTHSPTDGAGCADAAPAALRISFGAGTPREHVDRLVTALRELTRD